MTPKKLRQDRIPDELIDEILANYEKPEDLTGKGGLLKQHEPALSWPLEVACDSQRRLTPRTSETSKSRHHQQAATRLVICQRRAGLVHDRRTAQGVQAFLGPVLSESVTDDCWSPVDWRWGRGTGVSGNPMAKA